MYVGGKSCSTSHTASADKSQSCLATFFFLHSGDVSKSFPAAALAPVHQHAYSTVHSTQRLVHMCVHHADTPCSVWELHFFAGLAPCPRLHRSRRIPSAGASQGARDEACAFISQVAPNFQMLSTCAVSSTFQLPAFGASARTLALTSLVALINKVVRRALGIL